MKRFKTVHYTIHSNKIKDARGIRFAVIADLHGMEFGPDNRKLLEMIHRYRPDGILIAGDMILKTAGIHILHNESCSLQVGKTSLTVYGLEIPLIYYKKPFSPQLKREEIRELIGEPSSDSLNILLAHSPKYGDTYFDWGAELILSGHYHGGIVRIGRHNGLLSPQLHPFPKFCCGDFHRKEQHMLVSAGAGEHTIPVRIHNPRELLMVDLKPNA